MVYRKQEHQLLEEKDYPNEWCLNFSRHTGLLLNPKAEGIDKKYFLQFNCSANKWGYYTSYIIGAQWIDQEEKEALVVTPKEAFKHVDFLQLYTCCIKAGLESEAFSKIYGIELDKPRIDAPILDSILSPLLIVHYLSLIQKLIKKGLKRGYVQNERNIKKLKGKIDILKNEKYNVFNKKYNQIYCRYQEFSEDIAENRLLKKALRFSLHLLGRKGIRDNASVIIQKLNYCMCAFNNVNDDDEPYFLIRSVDNILYKEYKEAIRVAKIILKRCDYSISEAATAQHLVPVFWIDMALLFEHYVLGLLKISYKEKIDYQCYGNKGERPDFLLKNGKEKLILDTKYMYDVDNKIDIVRQLSGYARDEKILKKLDTHMSQGSFDDIIPCVFIYPTINTDIQNRVFDENQSLLNQCEKYEGFVQFYKLSIPLPLITKIENEELSLD